MTTKGKIVSEIEKELFEAVENDINGKEMDYIPNPIPRLRDIFNFHKEQYILLGSNTGTGKTSLVDHLLLSLIDNVDDSLDVEVLYYSMERKKKFKFAKWISWKYKQSMNIRVSSDTVMNRNKKLTKEKLDHMRKTFGPWLDNVMNHIDLRQGFKSVEQIERDIDRVARRLGTYYHSDSRYVYKGKDIIYEFSKDHYVTTKYGNRKYATLTSKGKDYTLYENSDLFIMRKPTLVFIVIDHIGKVKVVENKKKTLDSLDDILSNARDKYGFSPIAISQFNRAVGNTDRQKLHKGDLSPTLEDFKDTGNLSESADLVLSLFDPARYKSWNASGEYKGINIRDNTVTPSGQQRARSLHILKNTFGRDNGMAMLRFTGESMHFDIMPHPDDTNAINRMYNEIANGK